MFFFIIVFFKNSHFTHIKHVFFHFFRISFLRYFLFSIIFYERIHLKRDCCITTLLYHNFVVLQFLFPKIIFYLMLISRMCVNEKQSPRERWLPDQGLLCLWNYYISDPTLVDLTSAYVFVLCTKVKVYLYNYS